MFHAYALGVGQVAQVVEQWTENPRVVSATLTLSTFRAGFLGRPFSCAELSSLIPRLATGQHPAGGGNVGAATITARHGHA
jgi:hypothetical protein